MEGNVIGTILIPVKSLLLNSEEILSVLSEFTDHIELTDIKENSLSFDFESSVSAELDLSECKVDEAYYTGDAWYPESYNWDPHVDIEFGASDIFYALSKIGFCNATIIIKKSFVKYNGAFITDDVQKKYTM